MTEPTDPTPPLPPDDFPGTDPDFRFADRLLRLGHALARVRDELDRQRKELAVFAGYDNHSRYADGLCALLETGASSVDYVHREAARISAKMADDAYQRALIAAPKRPNGEGPAP